MNNYAYVALFGNNDYIYGVITLMYSGKRTNSKYPFYLLVTEDISQENREIAEMIGYHLIDVNEYQPKHFKERHADQTTIAGNTLDWYGRNKEDMGWQHAFTKILCFGLTQFDKVLFIDADVLFMRNIDEVFNGPHMSSVCWYEDSLNSAFMVIEPNEQLFKEMMLFCENYQTLRGVELFDDCGMIRDFYPDGMADKSKRIPNCYFYNFFWCQLEKENIYDWTNIYTMHMTGREKPWKTGKNYIENYWGSFEWHMVYWHKLYIEIMNNAIKDIKVKKPNCHLNYID